MMNEIKFDFAAYGINGDPEHNTNSVFCWCAPSYNPVTGVVVHKTMAEILSMARRAGHALETEEHNADYYRFVVGMDENGVYIATRLDDDDDTRGAGDTPLEAIACLCAVLEQHGGAKEAIWHMPFTDRRTLDTALTLLEEDEGLSDEGEHPCTSP